MQTVQMPRFDRDVNRSCLGRISGTDIDSNFRRGSSTDHTNSVEGNVQGRAGLVIERYSGVLVLHSQISSANVVDHASGSGAVLNRNRGHACGGHEINISASGGSTVHHVLDVLENRGHQRCGVVGNVQRVGTCTTVQRVNVLDGVGQGACNVGHASIEGVVTSRAGQGVLINSELESQSLA